MENPFFLNLLKKTFLFTLFCLMPLAMANTFLADRHAQRGLDCSACHQETPPQYEVDIERCQTCHGDYDALAKRTDATQPYNPHQTHLGEPECSDCHKGHQTPVLVCNDCHVYDMIVP